MKDIKVNAKLLNALAIMIIFIVIFSGIYIKKIKNSYTELHRQVDTLESKFKVLEER